MTGEARTLDKAMDLGGLAGRTADHAGLLLQSFFQDLGVMPNSTRLLESLPFAGGDVTVGTENELQATVIGARHEVDLPLSIEQSAYFAQRMQNDSPPASGLQAYLGATVWENSRVRVPMDALNACARVLVTRDLLADKNDPAKGRRRDADGLFAGGADARVLRAPISYLLKLALADVLGDARAAPAVVRRTGEHLLGCMLNDNTSPELVSAYVSPLARALGLGRAVAKENAQRFLLTQLLCAYANDKLQLKRQGQEALVYFSALPPERIKRLNADLPAPLYRTLFMNPCLSGWDRGEGKHDYMHLCHETLTASRRGALARLEEARMIGAPSGARGSDTSLANNGTHVSLGSLRLTRALRADSGGRARAAEKYAGDLAIKIVEHFLPLFVGTYTAAPYRIGVADFRPEKVLSFLPHQLGETDLRLLWRGWRKKALSAFSGLPQAALPLGNLLGLRGDFTPDYRLLDYFVALPGTAAHPALDGTIGNDERLKGELERRGIYHTRMTMYLPYRLREFATMGFSGFEGRYYSVFESLEHDLARAVELQALVSALAYKYIALGDVGHADIPDTPAVESERRSFLFGAAIGLSHVYLRKGGQNRFLRRLLAAVPCRQSKRYPNYYKVPLAAYRLALVRVLENDAADLIESHGMRHTLADLKQRLSQAGASAADRLTAAILQEACARSPLQIPAADFNAAAERYYRHTLRRRHVEEAFEFLIREAFRMDAAQDYTGELRSALRTILDGRSAAAFVQAARRELLAGTIDTRGLRTLIQLLLLAIARDTRHASDCLHDG